jgi:hypothetical protein
MWCSLRLNGNPQCSCTSTDGSCMLTALPSEGSLANLILSLNNWTRKWSKKEIKGTKELGWKISCFHSGDYEECRLLGCYAAWLLGTTLAVTSNRGTLRSVRRFLVTANVRSSPILFALMMKALSSSESHGVTSQKTAFYRVGLRMNIRNESCGETQCVFSRSDSEFLGVCADLQLGYSLRQCLCAWESCSCHLFIHNEPVASGTCLMRLQAVALRWRPAVPCCVSCYHLASHRLSDGACGGLRQYNTRPRTCWSWGLKYPHRSRLVLYEMGCEDNIKMDPQDSVRRGVDPAGSVGIPTASAL